jgi:hypothetical protein
MTVVRALPGSVFPGPPDAEIYVECVVPERDIKDALEAARQALLKLSFELRDVTRCTQCDLDHWDFEEHPIDGAARIATERVTKSGEVEIGPFFYGSGE